MLEDVEEDPAGKHRHPVRRQPVGEDRREGWAGRHPHSREARHERRFPGAESVRSANRAARTAGRSLLAGLRPLLMPGAAGSGPEGDVAGPALRPPSRGASCRRGGRRCDLCGRHASQRRQRRRRPARVVSQRRLGAGAADAHAGGTVRRLTRDLHIPAGDVGFWQGAIRDPGDPYPRSSSPRSQRTTDHRRYPLRRPQGRPACHRSLRPHTVEDGYLLTSSRYRNLDQRDPR